MGGQGVVVGVRAGGGGGGRLGTLALSDDQRGEERNARDRTVKEIFMKQKQVGKNGWMRKRRERQVRERDRRQREREREKSEPVTLDERARHCGLQLGMAGGRA